MIKTKWGYKSEEQISAIRNIKTLYKLREKVIKLFNDYFKVASKYNIKFWNKGFKDYQ